MTLLTFNKFDKYLVRPDLCYKFITSTHISLPQPRNFVVYLRYVISPRFTYYIIALKGLMLMEMLYPKRCYMTSKLIILKYRKTRCHCTIFLSLTGEQAFSFFVYTFRKPSSIISTINSFLKETTTFMFPGYVKILRLRTWERTINVSFQQMPIQYQYMFLFYKTALLN
jgi:hypothetical protein